MLLSVIGTASLAYFSVRMLHHAAGGGLLEPVTARMDSDNDSNRVTNLWIVLDRYMTGPLSHLSRTFSTLFTLFSV